MQLHPHTPTQYELSGDPVQAWHAGLAASFYTSVFEVLVIFLVKPITAMIPQVPD